MMMSPKIYKKEIENKTLKELFVERDKLIEKIKQYEENVGVSDDFKPSPNVQYLCNNEYLIEVIDLIIKKQKISNFQKEILEEMK